jgi:hypothetical protein
VTARAAAAAAVGDVYEDRRNPGRRVRLASRREHIRGAIWTADVIAHPIPGRVGTRTEVNLATLAGLYVRVDTSCDGAARPL